MIRKLLGLAFAIGLAAPAFAAEPAIVYDVGTKFDKSFNEAAFMGGDRYAKEHNITFREFEVQTDAQREQALRRFAEAGNNPIVAVGFLNQPALEVVAKEFPNTQFAIIDSVVDLPNVRSILFREDQGSYLVGVLAAMATETDKVGFVGGMDIGLIRKFACGFVQGVRSVSPTIEIFQNMTGDTGAAFNDPAKGNELARSQIDRGADVVYHAAGGTGIGVLQAVADAGKLGIGVDANQNYLHPGNVLTSMLKRVDNAVYDAFDDAANGAFTFGVTTLGLAEEGVGWALDDFNRTLITPDMEAAVSAAAAKIISGEIVVHDYTTDNACPMT